jgi:SAM-dependent methyltransferase
MNSKTAGVLAQGPELVEKASPGLHEAAFATLQRFAPPPARILDLGAGTGAWTKRLTSAGYIVTAVDNDPGEWALKSVPLVDRDLNREFAAGLGSGFDAVTSLEVIEHLENPSLFLRECRKLISPEGIVLLTTPNIENVAGRLRFLLTGHLRSFDREPLWNEPTHITPIQSYLIEKMCAAAGLGLVWHGFNSPTENTQGVLKRLLLGALRPLVRGVTGGDHHMFVLKRLG